MKLLTLTAIGLLFAFAIAVDWSLPVAAPQFLVRKSISLIGNFLFLVWTVATWDKQRDDLRVVLVGFNAALAILSAYSIYQTWGAR